MASRLDLEYGSKGASAVLAELAEIRAELNQVKATQRTLAKDKAPDAWFGRFVKGVGVFNTLNKGFDFLMKRIGQLNTLMTGWVDTTLEVGGAFQSATKQLEALLVGSGKILDVVDMTEQMGMSTEFTAEQASKATSSFIQLGFSASDALEGIPQILDLATARELDLETATDIAAQTTRQFNRDMSQLGETLDILNAVHVTSGSNIMATSRSMKNLGVVAAGAGLKLEEAAAMVGILGDVGLRGSSAGTGVRNMLIRLTTQMGTTKTALQELGITVKDTETGGFRPMMSILDDLGDTMRDLSDAERNYYGQRLAGSRGMIILTKLFDENSKGIRQYAQELKNATGITEEHAKVIRSTYENSTKIVQSATEAMAISMFNFIGGPATEFNNQLAIVYQAVAGGLKDLNSRIQAEGFNVSVISEGIAEIVDLAEPELASLFDLVKQYAEMAVTALEAIAPKALEAAKRVIQPVWSWIEQNVRDYLARIFGPEFREEAKSLLTEAGKVAGEAFLTALKSSDVMKFLGILMGAKALGGAITAAPGLAGGIAAAGKGAAAVTSMTIAPGSIAALAKAIGAAIATALKAIGIGAVGATAAVVGGAAYLGLDIAKGAYERKAHEEEMRGVQAMADELQSLYRKREEAIKQGDQALLGRIENAIEHWRSELTKEIGPFKMMEDAAKAANDKAQEIDWNQAIYDIADAAEKGIHLSMDELIRIQKERAAAAATPEGALREESRQQAEAQLQKEIEERGREIQRQADIRRRGVKIAESEGIPLEDAMRLSEEKQKQLEIDEKARQEQEEQDKLRLAQIEYQEQINTQCAEWLKAVMDASEAYRRVEEAAYELATIDMQAQLDLSELKGDIDEYLIQPINEFDQKMADIIGKFGKMRSEITESRISLKEEFAEAFPGFTPEKAAGERMRSSRELEDVLMQQMKLTQTAEGRAGVATELGGLLAERARTAEEPFKRKQFARQAEDYYAQAEKEAMEAEKVELEMLESQKQRNQERRGILEQMVGAEGPAGVKAPAYEQLLNIAKAEGDTQGVLEYQAGIEEAILAEAQQEHEFRTQELEYLRIIAESSKMTAEKTDIASREAREARGMGAAPGAPGGQEQQGRVESKAGGGMYRVGAGFYVSPPSPMEEWEYYKGYSETEEGEFVLEFGNV